MYTALKNKHSVMTVINCIQYRKINKYFLLGIFTDVYNHQVHVMV